MLRVVKLQAEVKLLRWSQAAVQGFKRKNIIIKRRKILREKQGFGRQQFSHHEDPFQGQKTALTHLTENFLASKDFSLFRSLSILTLI